MNTKQKSPWKWIALISLVVIAVIGYTAITKAPNVSTYSEPVTEKTPEELREELIMKERENPSSYLKNNGSWRKNFFGQTVLEGTISNTATLAKFKDVVLEVTWLTKTGTELKTEQYVLYEFFPAGKIIPYKIKVNAPQPTGDVRIEISSATPTE